MRLTRILVGVLPILLAATGAISCITQPLVHAAASTEGSVDPRALESYVRMAKVVRAVHAVAMEF